MSTEPKLGTSCPRCEGTGVYNFGKCSLCDGYGRLNDAGEPYGKRREGESAPAQPLDKTIEAIRNYRPERELPSAADSRKAAVPPAAETAQPQHCHADRDGDCSWKHCPQAVNRQEYCPLAISAEAETAPQSSWSEEMATVHNCGHTEAQHLYAAGSETAMTAEQLAQLFHETYERLAPQFGYTTRKASAKPWADVPKPNKLLMTAVCAEVAAHVRKAARGESMTSKQLIKDADALVDEIILHTSYTGNSGERQINRRNLVLAYAAHVREAAPGYTCPVCWTSSWEPCPEGTPNAVRNLGSRSTPWMVCGLCAAHEQLEAAERKLAEVEKVLAECLPILHGAVAHFKYKQASLAEQYEAVTKRAEAALASLRAESKEG